MKVKLHKDTVISVVKGKDLVGIYVITKCGNCNMKAEILLAEVSPAKAKKLVDNWNKE